MWDHDQLRAFDAQVAEEIFGLVPCEAECHVEGAVHYVPGPCHANPISPTQGAETCAWTTSNSQAFNVIHQMRRLGLSCHVKNWVTSCDWEVSFYTRMGSRVSCITDAWLSVTVCRAALEAVRNIKDKGG